VGTHIDRREYQRCVRSRARRDPRCASRYRLHEPATTSTPRISAHPERNSTIPEGSGFVRRCLVFSLLLSQHFGFEFWRIKSRSPSFKTHHTQRCGTTDIQTCRIIAVPIFSCTVLNQPHVASSLVAGSTTAKIRIQFHADRLRGHVGERAAVRFSSLSSPENVVQIRTRILLLLPIANAPDVLAGFQSCDRVGVARDCVHESTLLSFRLVNVAVLS